MVQLIGVASTPDLDGPATGSFFIQLNGSMEPTQETLPAPGVQADGTDTTRTPWPRMSRICFGLAALSLIVPIVLLLIPALPVPIAILFLALACPPAGIAGLLFGIKGRSRIAAAIAVLLLLLALFFWVTVLFMPLA